MLVIVPVVIVVVHVIMIVPMIVIVLARGSRIAFCVGGVLRVVRCNRKRRFGGSIDIPQAHTRVSSEARAIFEFR